MATTQIYYGLVSYGRKVVCDSTLTPGSYESLCQSALDTVEASSYRQSQQENIYKDRNSRFNVCIYSSLGLLYVCVVSRTFQRNLAFACLREVEEKFAEKGLNERAVSAKPYSLRRDFSAILLSVLSTWSSQDRLGRVERMRDEAQEVVTKTVQGATVCRTDKLRELTRQSESIKSNTAAFRRNKNEQRDTANADRTKNRCGFCCCFRSPH